MLPINMSNTVSDCRCSGLDPGLFLLFVRSCICQIERPTSISHVCSDFYKSYIPGIVTLSIKLKHQLVDLIYSSNFEQIISLPTRCENILDLCIINMLRYNLDTGVDVPPDPDLDHSLIWIIFFVKYGLMITMIMSAWTTYFSAFPGNTF